MKTHTILVSSNYETFKSKVVTHLESHPQIINFNYKAFKDKTLLKVKSEDNLRNHQVKLLIYSSGIYAKPISGFLNKVLYNVRMFLL